MARLKNRCFDRLPFLYLWTEASSCCLRHSSRWTFGRILTRCLNRIFGCCCFLGSGKGGWSALMRKRSTQTCSFEAGSHLDPTQAAFVTGSPSPTIQSAQLSQHSTSISEPPLSISGSDSFNVCVLATFFSKKLGLSPAASIASPEALSLLIAWDQKCRVSLASLQGWLQ